MSEKKPHPYDTQRSTAITPAAVTPDPTPAPEVVVKPSTPSTVKFFTEDDMGRDKNGNLFIKNAYPTHMSRKQVDDLEEEIRMTEYGLENNHFPPDRIGEAKERLVRNRKALDRMRELEPSFKANEDAIVGAERELSEQISGSMFTYTDMMKGTADPHEIARRATEPVIPVSGPVAQMALANGIRVDSRGRITGTDATRLWQMCRTARGETRNPEVLRRG